MAHVIMETEKFHDLQLASWRPRKAYVIVTVYVQRLEIRRASKFQFKNWHVWDPKTANFFKLNLKGGKRLPSSVQSLSRAQLFVTPWTEVHQASLSVTNFQSLLKLMSIKLVIPSNHLILCCPLLLPSIFPSIRVFSSESVLCIRWPKY